MLLRTASTSLAWFAFLGLATPAQAQRFADDAGTDARRLVAGDYTAHANSFVEADDIVVAQKVDEHPAQIRPLTLGWLENPEAASQIAAYVEVYQVLASLHGVATGQIQCVVIGNLAEDGGAPPLRQRAIGTKVVAAVDAQIQGKLIFSWKAFDPQEVWGEVVPAQPGEWTLLLSATVTNSEFPPNLSNPNEAFLCSAIEALGSISSDDEVRTLTMLMNLSGSSVSSAYGTRTSRALLGKVDALDPRHQWMGYAALRNWELPGLRPNLVNALIPVATNPDEWARVPESAKSELLRALDPGRDATLAPSRMRLFDSAAHAMDTLVRVQDQALVIKFIQLLPYYNYQGWGETRLRELWASRTPGTEMALLRALPVWTGLRDKVLVRGDVPPSDYLNQQELVDFWTQWLSAP